MKKFLSILLCAMLMMTILCAPYVLAEATKPPASPAAPAPTTYTINLTGLIIAILVAFFEFLLAWLMKAVIPPLKKWLDSHTTKNQQQLVWNVVNRLVEAAEQTITGCKRGKDKMRYVLAGLREHGFSVEPYLIEAAVKEMNDRALYEIAHELNIETAIPFDDPPEDDPEEKESE